MSKHSNHDHYHYIDWRATRIAKLEQVFGKEYFKDKSVLECGAGTGLVGKFLREEWGADVSFTEGREELLGKIRDNNFDGEIYLVNHERDWYPAMHFALKYDVIIHWGLLYHLNYWQEDLQRVRDRLNPGGVLVLETEVLDFDSDTEKKIEESAFLDDQSLQGVGTQMTPTAVENQLKNLGFTFKRYDDKDLNCEFHHYDWVSSNSGKYGAGQRRYWVCYS